MAREDKGKFLGLLNSKYITDGKYNNTFDGATLIPSKLKVGATEEDPYGFVIDAIDIDWGGLSMRSVTSEKQTDQGKVLTPTLGIVTHVSYDSAQNAKEDKGIISTGYALAKISESFENIIDVIGKTVLSLTLFAVTISFKLFVVLIRLFEMFFDHIYSSIEKAIRTEKIISE